MMIVILSMGDETLAELEKLFPEREGRGYAMQCQQEQQATVICCATFWEGIKRAALVMRSGLLVLLQRTVRI